MGYNIQRQMKRSLTTAWSAAHAAKAEAELALGIAVANGDTAAAKAATDTIAAAAATMAKPGPLAVFNATDITVLANMADYATEGVNDPSDPTAPIHTADNPGGPRTTFVSLGRIVTESRLCDRAVDAAVARLKLGGALAVVKVGQRKDTERATNTWLIRDPDSIAAWQAGHPAEMAALAALRKPRKPRAKKAVADEVPTTAPLALEAAAVAYDPDWVDAASNASWADLVPARPAGPARFNANDEMLSMGRVA